MLCLWQCFMVLHDRVAEVVRGHGGPPPKSLDSDENFKPEHTLFFRKLRFVAIYSLFGNLWTKKVFFGGGQKQCFLVYIAFIMSYTQNDAFVPKMIKYALDEKFYDHFCLRQKAVNFCHPGHYHSNFPPPWLAGLRDPQ